MLNLLALVAILLIPLSPIWGGHLLDLQRKRLRTREALRRKAIEGGPHAIPAREETAGEKADRAYEVYWRETTEETDAVIREIEQELNRLQWDKIRKAREPRFCVGDRVVDAHYGPGTVTRVDDDYNPIRYGLDLDSGVEIAWAPEGRLNLIDSNHFPAAQPGARHEAKPIATLPLQGGTRNIYDRKETA